MRLLLVYFRKNREKQMKLNAKNKKIDKRRATYSVVATELALLSDQRLTELVKNAVPIGKSIGGE